MIFFASWYDCEENPKYPEYRLVNGYHIDRRNADSPDKIPYYKEHPDMVQKDWYGTGKNHRVVNGKIEKDSEEINFYVIELNTLEDLIGFQNKYNTNTCIGDDSGYVFDGKELKYLHEDFLME
jgi:hypothetical protein